MKIHLIPEGGLGNRLRAIGSAVALGKLTGRTISVNWYQTKDLNARFADLFQTDNLPFELLEHDARGLREIIPKSYWRIREYVLGMVSRPALNLVQAEAIAGDVDALRSMSQKTGTFYIRTYSRLVNDPAVFTYFRPIQPIQQIIDSYLPRLQRSVGVHIRRTDNKLAVSKSPTGQFISQMHIECGRKPDTHFFVATDSPAEYNRLAAEFGDAVFQHQKRSLDRNSTQAIVDAVVDLYCLASCRSMIGSFGSTFSDAASEINQIEYTIIGGNVTSSSPILQEQLAQQFRS